MIYKKLLEEEKLKRFLNENGRIIFIKDSNLLNEAFYVYNDKNSIMVRNKKDDGISHHRTFKLKTKKYRNGIPIIFNKIKISDDNYVWEWEVDPDANISKKDIKNIIGKKEKDFIDSTLELIGDEMIEYWKLDVKKKNEQERLDYLTKKYNGSELK